MGQPGTAIPKRNASIDPRSLPLGSVEAFVLSCIDGKASLDELADLSGMTIPQVTEAVARLAELGAIVVEEPTSAPGGAKVAPRAPRPPSGVRVPGTAGAPAAPAAEEAVDLAPERKKMVLEAFERLDHADFYALLGIPDTADKNEVRSAYFALSKVFHPDTMYGKQLGSYKAKMEAIFKRATEAYETLSKRKRRDEYDKSIGLPDLDTRLEAAKSAPAPTAPAAAPADPAGSGRISSVRPRPSVEVTIDATASAAEARFSRPSPRFTPQPFPVAAPEPPSSAATPSRDGAATAPRPSPQAAAARESSPPAPRPSPASDSARQKAQQRILNEIAQRTGRPLTPVPPARPASPPPQAPAPREAPSGRESILRGLAGSLRDAGRVTGSDRIEKQLRAASASEQAGDLLGALNALRVARESAPDREDVAREYQRVRFAYAKSHAADFEAQALREERMEMWAAAAISWGRVAEGRPESALAHRRAAQCIVASNGDMRRARDLAQRAVDLAPTDVPSRVVLAKVYVAAGMKLNAKRELEAAAKLDPKDEFVKNLLREMKP